MAGSNNPLSPPPVRSAIIDNKTTNLGWSAWFTALHKLVSPNYNKQAITGTSSVDLDAVYVSLTTTNASYVITLDPPTVAGLRKQIDMTTHTPTFDVTMALTNMTGDISAFTTCTWSAADQQILLESTATKWLLVKQNGFLLS